MPKGSRWQRIEELFERAVEQPEAEQAAFVAASGEEEDIRREVIALLHHASTGPALGDLVAGAASELATDQHASLIGSTIGPFRLTALIGEGGMGAVYLAERVGEFQQRVAIKVLQHGFGSPQAIARFRDERQILASLEHPGIVRLLDGGTTEGGLPYLVMEHVDGVPLAAYAAGHALSVPARVELILQLCAAVQYAHARLVVHRDLKPGNILVTRDGTAKLLDFGIARLLDPTATREAHTRTGAMPLTPEYASPEQARGEAVTVASDVYSLGAVLYELLAGRSPHPRASSALEMLRAICEVEPPRPSTVAPPELRRQLAGDLDNIVLKALQKQPDRRYVSIEQLAADLQRYRSGMPVQARPATLRYRAGKFVRRHRAALAAATVVVAALTTATIVSLREARRAEAQAARAERKFAQVRALANAVLFEFDRKLENVAGATEARQLMVTRALEYLDHLTAEAGHDRELARDLALAYVKVGDIQGNFYEPFLGDLPGGLASYHKASAIVERLLAEDPADVATRRIKVTVELGTAVIEHALARPSQAKQRIFAALALYDALPATDEYDRYVFRAYLSLTYMGRQFGDPEQFRWLDDMKRRIDRWHAAHPSHETRYARGISLDTTGEAAVGDADPDAGCRSMLAAQREFEQLVAEAPNDARFVRERAYNWLDVAACRSGAGNVEIWTPDIADLQGAETAARASLEILARLAADPRDVRATSLYAYEFAQLGLIVEPRSADEAAHEYDRALRLYEMMPDDARTNDPDRWYLYCLPIAAFARSGQPERARTLATQALAIATKLADSPGAELDARTHAQMCRYEVARGYHALGDIDEAIRVLEPTIGALEQLLGTRARWAIVRNGLAQALELLAELRPADACRLRARAAETWHGWPGARTPFIERQLAGIARRMTSCPP